MKSVKKVKDGWGYYDSKGDLVSPESFKTKNEAFNSYTFNSDKHFIGRVQVCGLINFKKK